MTRTSNQFFSLVCSRFSQVNIFQSFKSSFLPIIQLSKSLFVSKLSAMAEEEAEEEPPSVNRLPNELLFDIFSRFPPKALCRLRCVCVRWSSILTTDPDFISLYHRNRRLNPLLLFSRRRIAAVAAGESDELLVSCHCIDGGAARFNIAAEFPGKLIWILSCRGIVCLISELKVFLYDPATGRASNLTGSPNFKSSSSAALGYSATTGEFKLLHFYVAEKFDNYHYEQMKELRCEVLTVPKRLLGFDSSSLESHEWRSLGRSKIEVLGRKSNVCVDGSVFWLVAEKAYNPNSIRILSFDLEPEEFGVECFPRKYSDRSAECLGLVEMKEKLCLTDRLQWETEMTVWELEDRSKKVWIKKYVVDVAEFRHTDLKILGHFCSSIGGGEGVLVIKVAGVNETRLYDLEKGTYRVIEIQVENDGEEETDELELLLDRKDLL